MVFGTGFCVQKSRGEGPLLGSLGTHGRLEGYFLHKLTACVPLIISLETSEVLVLLHIPVVSRREIEARIRRLKRTKMNS